MLQLGLDPGLARACEPEPEEEPETEDVELTAEQWDAWQAFLGTLRQWRVIAGMGGVVFDGIDNACLESTLRMLQIKSKHWPRVFWQIRVLEDEARKLRNQ